MAASSAEKHSKHSAVALEGAGESPTARHLRYIVAMSALDPVEAIRDLSENAYILGKLIEQVQTPVGVTPFVGAGLSRPYGFPLWTEFLLKQASHARHRGSNPGSIGPRKI